MVKQIGGKGNILFLGGPAGNPVTRSAEVVVEVFAKHPGMKVLTGTKTGR